MTKLIILKNIEGNYVEYKGKVLKFEHIVEEGYGEYDFFDMNPAALNGPTTVYHTFKIGDFETKYVHDISGPVNSSTLLPTFYACDCEDGMGFKVIAKTLYAENVLGIVKFDSTL